MVAKNDAKSAFIASYFGDENDDFSAFTKYHLIVDALHDEISVSEIFSRIVADPRFRMFYDLGNFGKSESKIGFDVNLDFLNLKISGKLSLGNIKVIDLLDLEAEKYFAKFEYSHDSTQLRKKRNRGSKNQIFDDIEAEIAILWPKNFPKTEKFVTGFDFFGSKYLMNDKISFRVANNYEKQYSKLSGIVFKYFFRVLYAGGHLDTAATPYLCATDLAWLPYPGATSSCNKNFSPF